jgi:hypothetical protein
MAGTKHAGKAKKEMTQKKGTKKVRSHQRARPHCRPYRGITLTVFHRLLALLHQPLRRFVRREFLLGAHSESADQKARFLRGSPAFFESSESEQVPTNNAVHLVMIEVAHGSG